MSNVTTDFGNSNWCKREYRQYQTWVEAGKWGGWGEADRTAPFGKAGLGERGGEVKQLNSSEFVFSRHPCLSTPPIPTVF